MDCKELAATLPPIPESVERVLCAMDSQPKTMQMLQRESGLARRTVYNAVQRLQSLQMVASQRSLRDSRQTWYWLRDSRRA